MSKTLSITEGYDPNYLAVVVTIKNISPHSNADKLECTEVFGNNIIIGKGSYSVGETVVYFPVESCISLKFLSWANLLEKPELNSDQKTKGYFDCKKGRVRAVSLRSMPSQGFLFKVSELAKYYDVDEKLFKVGDCFNCVGDDTLVTKWVKETKGTNTSVKKSRVPRWLESTIGVFPRPVRLQAYKFVNAWYNRNAEGIKNRIVDGQFAFHYSTEQLGRNIYLVKPDDDITITVKCHGCSAVYGNILVKRPFNPFRNLFNVLGRNIPSEEYQFIYSSRERLRNRKDGKFSDDIWGINAEKVKDSVDRGILLYGELVGYVPSGRMVQKNYHYSVPEGQSEFWVYRIVEVTSYGERYEYTWQEISKYCEEHNLKTVPEYFSGKASDLFNISIDDNWNDNFLHALQEKYLDQTCEYNPGMPNEGIVLKINSRESKPVFKFKSSAFLVKESSERDKGESNLEEEN